MDSQNNTNRFEQKTAAEHVLTEHTSVTQYLSETLGLRTFLQDLKNSSVDTSVNLSVKSPVQDLHSPDKNNLRLLYVFVQDFNNYKPEEHDLLQKMLVAMKIDLTKIRVQDLVDFNANDIQSSLVFQMVDVVVQSENQTHSPRMLLKNLKLKNEAWTFLQKIMKQYQSLS